MRERGEERVIRWVLIIGRLVEDRLLVPLRRHKPSPEREREGESAEGCQRDERRCDSRRYADRAYLELADASQSIYLAKVPLDRRPPPIPRHPAISIPTGVMGMREDEATVCRRARTHSRTPRCRSNRCRKDQF